MEFTCEKADLYQGVQSVEKIVAARSTLPIIGNILVEATKGGVKLSTNNLEIGMEVLVKAKVDKEGAALLPAKTFSGLVSKLPGTNISLKASDKGSVKIAYKQSSFNINSLKPDEFPLLPKIKEPKSIMIDAELFSEMVKQTIFAVSLSEDKYVLNGVLMEFGKSGEASDTSNIRLVATDGYRLAKRGGKISGPVTDQSSAIVPAKALIELVRAIQNQPKGELSISLGSDQIAFKYKNYYIVSRRIQGQFPDYRKVVPKGSESKVTVEKGAFLESAERAGVIASNSANIIRVEVKSGKMHLFASAPEVGNVNEVLDADVKGSDKSQIAFNVRLVIDALKVISSDKVMLELSGPLSAGLLRPVGGENYTYIVMPIRTAETST
ncbi:DNA polymerase III subunit beta [Candidatus Margulisiibacteriota bacterium]